MITGADKSKLQTSRIFSAFLIPEHWLARITFGLSLGIFALGVMNLIVIWWLKFLSYQEVQVSLGVIRTAAWISSVIYIAYFQLASKTSSNKMIKVHASANSESATDKLAFNA